jgi:hypothetical protein
VTTIHAGKLLTRRQQETSAPDSSSRTSATIELENGANGFPARPSYTLCGAPWLPFKLSGLFHLIKIYQSHEEPSWWGDWGAQEVVYVALIETDTVLGLGWIFARHVGIPNLALPWGRGNFVHDRDPRIHPIQNVSFQGYQNGLSRLQRSGYASTFVCADTAHGQKRIMGLALLDVWESHGPPWKIYPLYIYI